MVCKVRASHQWAVIRDESSDQAFSNHSGEGARGQVDAPVQVLLAPAARGRLRHGGERRCHALDAPRRKAGDDGRNARVMHRRVEKEWRVRERVEGARALVTPVVAEPPDDCRWDIEDAASPDGERV